MKLTGIVEHQDIEGGVFVLRTDDGTVYAMAGGDRKLRKAGLHVEVEGAVDDQAVGIAMTGPIFRVKSYRVIG